MNNKRIILLLTAALFVNSCSKSEINNGEITTRSQAGLKSNALNEIDNPTLTITDETSTPVAGAKILIGNALNDPQEGNFIQADQFGKAALPFHFSNQPITVSAPGFLRVTIYNQDSVSKTIKLKTSDIPSRIEITGQTLGFGNVPKDGQADFGLVLSALSKREVFSFNSNLIISPENDTFEVVGQTEKVPSNLTFPRQKESYIIPITLEKERYRMYFSNPGKKTVLALRGQFPFKKVVDALRSGKKVSSLLNDFSVKSVGLTEMNFKTKTNLNLPVNQIPFPKQTAIRAPNIGAENSLLVIPLLKHQDGYIPTDIKNLNEGQAAFVNSPAEGELYILGAVQKKSQFRGDSMALTLTVSPLASGLPATQLGNFELHSFTQQGWSSEFPTNPNQLQETATYSVLSAIQPNGSAAIRTRKWEVISHGWVNQINLPHWPEPSEFNLFADVGTHQRWEVSFLGSQAMETFDFNSDIIDTVSHVSYNSKDF